MPVDDALFERGVNFPILNELFNEVGKASGFVILSCSLLSKISIGFIREIEPILEGDQGIHGAQWLAK